MRHLSLHVATWILSRLAPASEREPLVGDLIEEYSLRANTASSSAARGWFLRQVCASVPSLLWARLTRTAWLSTFGVALLGYIAVGVVEVIVNWAISSSAAYNPLGMFITFPMVVVIGYFAARLRREAPIVLGAMMFVAVTVMTFSANESLPLWYRIAYFIVGPAAAFIGSALSSRRAVR